MILWLRPTGKNRVDLDTEFAIVIIGRGVVGAHNDDPPKLGFSLDGTGRLIIPCYSEKSGYCPRRGRVSSQI